jgi:hypothetical protein
MNVKLGIYVVYTQYLKKIERWFVFCYRYILKSVYVFEENIKGFMRIC